MVFYRAISKALTFYLLILVFWTHIEQQALLSIVPSLVNVVNVFVHDTYCLTAGRRYNGVELRMGVGNKVQPPIFHFLLSTFTNDNIKKKIDL